MLSSRCTLRSILRNTAKKWLQWLRKRVKKKTLQFRVIYCGQVWIGGTPRKLKLYREVDFHYEVWSWNKMKNKTLGLTGSGYSKLFTFECSGHIFCKWFVNYIKDESKAVASEGAVVPGPPFEIGASPFHVWPPGCYIHPILYFKNVAPPSGFWPPCC